MKVSLSTVLKTLFIISLLATAVGCKSLPAAPPEAVGPAAENRDYTIQPGDLLEISVWKEKDLQREVLVRPDGGISFPLAGEFKAAGKTMDELRKEIATKLGKLIPDASVTVAIRNFAGNRVYVIGKVQKPGDFVAPRNMTVMHALSMAGGTTPFAAVNDIVILRRINGTQTAIPFKYGQVESGKNLDQNIVLQGGDVVVVP